ncbi:unnamed protein product [Orchesella dallaii]|uniref:Uncharacterized protein n=1 Tax=Orchesella dallaii TaxID=48710 RepID=A0ABP1RQA8_9HEXA
MGIEFEATTFLISNSINPTVISGDQNEIHFITCAPISKPTYISLIGYVSAFRLNTWLVILVSLALTVITWNLVQHKQLNKTNRASVMVFYNLLVAQGTSSINTCKWLTGAWVLAGLFLTYNYQGNNIDQLTSPLTPKKMETFEEIFSNNLTVFSLPDEYELYLMYARMNVNIIDYFDALMAFYDDRTISDHYLRKQLNVTEIDAKKRLKTILKSPVNDTEAKTMLDFDYYIQQLSKCGHDVFMDKLLTVNRMHYQLRKSVEVKTKDIAISKKPYGRFYERWSTGGLSIPTEYYEVRFLSLIHSGLVKLWNDWKYRVDTWNETVNQARLPEVAKVKALSTDDNIVVVFYLHILCLVFSIVPLLFECRKYLLSKAFSLISSIFALIAFVGNVCIIPFIVFMDCFQVVFMHLIRTLHQGR